MLKESRIDVEDVSAITGKSSILQGRVKTLHQAVSNSSRTKQRTMLQQIQVHGGILARDTVEDKVDLANENIQMIDYVICNLCNPVSNASFSMCLTRVTRKILSKRPLKKSMSPSQKLSKKST